MESVSITEQTRLQVERAQRAAEEARTRRQAARSRWSRPGEDSDRHPPDLDDEQTADYGAD